MTPDLNYVVEVTSYYAPIEADRSAKPTLEPIVQ